MNTPNNQRRKNSQKKIEAAFVQLLQQRELNEISVTDICKLAGVNRTTFYANYLDIYDLAEVVQKNLEADVLALYQDEWERGRSSHDFLKLFRHIKANPLFYSTYFKLNTGGELRFIGYNIEDAAARFGNRHVEYHIEFFAHGLNAVIRKWLQNGCQETPEEIMAIITDEYQGVSLAAHPEFRAAHDRQR